MKSLPLWLLLGFLIFCEAGRGQGVLIPATYAVQGAPFTATVETNSYLPSSAGPRQSTQRILRDSAGRQRYEGLSAIGAQQSSLATIYDVVAGKSIKLDMNAKTAEVTPMRVGRAVVMDAATATTSAPSIAAEGQTLLGTKEIAGLEAWGQRTVKTITRADGSTFMQDRELWISTHYRMPVMQVLRSEQGKTTESVVSFSAGEPDPALFRIPEGYSVREALPANESAPATVRAGGKYSPPVIIKSVEAQYSEEARHKLVNGVVLVGLIVDERGWPQHLRILRGVGSGLDEQAIKAVKQYRFKPAMSGDVPVSAEMTVEVSFKIFHP